MAPPRMQTKIVHAASSPSFLFLSCSEEEEMRTLLAAMLVMKEDDAVEEEEKDIAGKLTGRVGGGRRY